MTEESSEEEREALVEVEKKLRDQELHKARLWRVRSREKWITEEDAPTRYFFAKTKARWARESLEALTKSDGEAREEAVSLITKKLDLGDSTNVSAVPEEEEIRVVIFGMKANKALGGDGLPAEVVKACWEFFETDLVKLVRTVWAKRRLLKSDLQPL
ncbi:hypothetical protein R1sor_024730 [Riccia sorocarpa]|uniref:Uncharacterized protein n=1 Tax=Riccia sorocarpa TaxID=122646 RepID=A0ABD3GVB5_9MARC